MRPQEAKRRWRRAGCKKWRRGSTRIADSASALRGSCVPALLYESSRQKVLRSVAWTVTNHCRPPRPCRSCKEAEGCCCCCSSESTADPARLCSHTHHARTSSVRLASALARRGTKRRRAACTPRGSKKGAKGPKGWHLRFGDRPATQSLFANPQSAPHSLLARGARACRNGQREEPSRATPARAAAAEACAARVDGHACVWMRARGAYPDGTTVWGPPLWGCKRRITEYVVMHWGLRRRRCRN